MSEADWQVGGCVVVHRAGYHSPLLNLASIRSVGACSHLSAPMERSGAALESRYRIRSATQPPAAWKYT